MRVVSAFVRFLLFAVTVLPCVLKLAAQFPQLPARVGGTLTVDGSSISVQTSDQFEFRVERPGGVVLTPAAITFGRTPAGGFAVDYTVFDAALAPTGVTPAATLTLTVRRNGQSLTILSPAGGAFASGTAGSLTTVNLALSSVSGRIINLSILTTVTASSPLFTVGTVIGGAGTSGSKAILVRVAGPSLAQLGVAGALADPKLDLFSGQTVIASNDNWGGTAALSAAFAQVGAFAYTSGTSKDAAVSSGALPVGAYTVQITGVGGATGVVIAELYDATPAASFTSATPRLINVSVLKQINAGEILTAGFVIGGSGSKTVLIRAVGPTLGLAPFNIGGVMADPKVDLFSGQTVIAANDNWGGGTRLASAFASVGAFTLSATSKDAAILVTLQPGSYTAQVNGLNNTGGIAIVEVYEVP